MTFWAQEWRRHGDNVQGYCFDKLLFKFFLTRGQQCNGFGLIGFEWDQRIPNGKRSFENTSANWALLILLMKFSFDLDYLRYLWFTYDLLTEKFHLFSPTLLMISYNTLILLMIFLWISRSLMLLVIYLWFSYDLLTIYLWFTYDHLYYL